MNAIVSVTVPVDPGVAFRVFVEEIGSWWPREYTWSGDVLQDMRIEPQANGHCYEVGPQSFRCDWGRVLSFDPPSRIVFTWQIDPSRTPQPDPERCGEVEVSFEPQDAGATRLTLEHRGFERHGSGGDQYRDAMAADAGWPYIMQRFVQHCTG